MAANFAQLLLIRIGVAVGEAGCVPPAHSLIADAFARAERPRAVSIAIIYLFANLIGMGLGPLAAGALSDALRPLFGSESLRYALLPLCPGYVWGAWHLWRASKTVTRDLAHQ